MLYLTFGAWRSFYGTNSNAPMSQAGPCGRVTPRWSVGGQPLALVPPWSIAGLPASSAWVWVGPPLPASGASSGSVPDRSVAWDSRHEVPLSRLNPNGSLHRFPKQLVPGLLLAMIVPVAVTLPELEMPAELAAMVTYDSVMVSELSTACPGPVLPLMVLLDTDVVRMLKMALPPVPPLVLLPLMVLLSTVSVPSPLAMPPPPSLFLPVAALPAIVLWLLV